MRITNKLNLPTPLVSMAMENYQVQPNEYRVTSLLKGIRETILERRHGDEIEQDVSDMIWLLFGTAVHNVLEHHIEGDRELKEERIKAEIEGYILSGKFDLYNDETETVSDYKTCSVWKVIYGDYTDWRRQLLIYCYILRSIGFHASNGEIVALMKDYSKRDAKLKDNYPQFPVQKIEFHFTDEDFSGIEVWLSDTFNEIRRCENLPDDKLPICTSEERYNSGDKYAVMKNGRKTALRVLDTEEEAKACMEFMKGDYIETRCGEDKKCNEYCNVNKYCSYYQSKNGGVSSSESQF